ncbi:MAG: NAD(P)H-binding protein [Pseudonocardia sp.]|uniref:NAD(P)H-binding protein n=1 Tax=Pseudonocardia sp. TaxID=60912 RepID=UPI001AD52FBB|nr:NAD(P)H-binding protein [Pseudonocardia sp.]MBN9102673.1 NAD(P)H-binding protein [Pseudonocardia sp.]
MGDEIWVLGATGRTGRAVADRLHAAGHPVVLVGRDPGRLAGQVDGARVVVGEIDDVLGRLHREAPAAVVNTIGPFTVTAPRVVRACPPGTHYVDVAAEYRAAAAVLDLHGEAAATGRSFVTGAGFGVLATESVLRKVCGGGEVPSAVRVDAVASVAAEPGVVGSALASTIVDAASFGGRRVTNGRLTRSRFGAEPATLTTPDGDVVLAGSSPTAELLAAWRASGADSVVAASGLIPAGVAARLLSAVSPVVRVPGVARAGVALLARVPLKSQDRPRRHSWARARAEWPSGAAREGWLRAGDGMDFTSAAAAEVALRLARGEGRPGAYFPGELFGAELAVAAGGEFILDVPAGR